MILTLNKCYGLWGQIGFGPINLYGTLNMSAPFDENQDAGAKLVSFAIVGISLRTILSIRPTIYPSALTSPAPPLFYQIACLFLLFCRHGCLYESVYPGHIIPGNQQVNVARTLVPATSRFIYAA